MGEVEFRYGAALFVCGVLALASGNRRAQIYTTIMLCAWAVSALLPNPAPPMHEMAISVLCFAAFRYWSFQADYEQYIRRWPGIILIAEAGIFFSHIYVARDMHTANLIIVDVLYGFQIAVTALVSTIDMARRGK